MSNLTSILRAIEFIEDHLQSELCIADVAEAVSYSVFHFCRMFNVMAHHSPYDYLIRRRLSEAGRALVETDQKIIDIALDFQFNNPETFSRAFRRMFGMQPRQWRTEGRLDRRMLLPRLTPEHLAYRNGPDFAMPTLEGRESVQVAGVMAQVDDDLGAIPTLWETLRSELECLGGDGAVDAYYGIICYPKRRSAGNVFYMASASVDSLLHCDSVLVTKTLPAGRYACMPHAGGPDTLSLALDYVHHTWLPRKGLSPSSSFAIERRGAPMRPGGQRTILIPVE
jgi:AraC family transcriptional regulator